MTKVGTCVDLRRREALALACFGLWAIAPVLVLLVRAADAHGAFTGAFAPLSGADPLRYLAWIRDAGGHGLIANRAAGAASDHVYLHPMFLLSGLVWRLGVDLRLSYLAWFPFVIAVVGGGYLAFARRLATAESVPATLAVALLSLSVFAPLLDYSHLVTATEASHLIDIAGPLSTFWWTWGYLPSALAIGLMPCYLLLLERRLNRSTAGTASRRDAIFTSGVAALSAWLSPWSGLTLLLVTLGLAIWQHRFRRLVIPALALGAPLAYYAALARYSAAWHLTSIQALGVPSHYVVALVIVLLPLAALALPGAMTPTRGEPAQQAVRLWPVAALVLFVLMPSGDRAPVLGGLTLPLAMLAAQGWQRLRLRPGWGAAAVLVMSVPGMFYAAHTFRDYVQDHYVPYTTTRNEESALHYVATVSRARPVLATPYIAHLVPSQLDAGASRGYDSAGASLLAPERTLAVVFAGGAGAQQVRQVLAREQVSILLTDCRAGHAALSRQLGELGFIRHAFGCATVYTRG
ncbi:MAG: hypothetical protein ACR2ND_13660 [Solirubrobacteraceae bacterium]